ncbi:telomeric repeat-binding factor 1 [Parambassis ranga]|uniref:Telomeric repeat-binding factor n=1 Tax=Parambassis ranga TaxID=210632 RepID=A0A6P7KHV1_9TELE|nr:telomeric repeat-binding factor 1 [Parambassis ranga]XP_028289060.1 telomeric repeat-binding factor 1 [Parambassis ranga]
MDPDETDKSASYAQIFNENVSFPHITDVATEWMLDFMFVSLCRRFNEGKLEEFNETLSTYEAILKTPSLNENLHHEKKMICAFLARVMHGKQLDVLFEEDDSVMPLMSAANIWSDLEHTVADESLFKNIIILLFVQSVAVCLEKGQTSLASSALKWFMDNHNSPRNVGIKLTTVVAQKETYHPFLMSFSFTRLLETIQSYLEAYLEKNPSDFLFKAATKIVQSSQSTEDLKEMVPQKGSLSASKSTEEDQKQKQSTACFRTKRKLLSTKTADVWIPDGCKKAYISVKRLSRDELVSQITPKTSMDTSNVQRRKRPQKWTQQLDQYLIKGVDRHGQGNWSRILLDYDFEGRTGVMLKDRWRVLKKGNMVN